MNFQIMAQLDLRTRMKRTPPNSTQEVAPASSNRKPIVEREILNSMIRGQTDLRDRFIRTVQPHLYRFCLYLTSDTARAQDLAQETLIKVLSNIQSLRDPNQFDGWMFRIAKNLVFDRVKSAESKVERFSQEFIEDGATGLYGAEVELPKMDAILAVRETLARLEVSDRAVLVLVDCQEFSCEEAAEVLGLSVSAVRSRMPRARRRFLEIFDEESKQRGTTR